MTQKLNKRGRPMFERTVFGRLRRSVDFGDGKLVAFKFVASGANALRMTDDKFRAAAARLGWTWRPTRCPSCKEPNANHAATV